jgi:hypothetical protein
MNESEDEVPDRVRRRLLKLTAYVPPMILSLRAEHVHAGCMAPVAGAKVPAQVQVQTQAKVQVG